MRRQEKGRSWLSSEKGNSARRIRRRCGLSATALLKLKRRTLHRAVRAEYTAITCFRTQHHPTVRALVKELACIEWHDLRCAQPAMRARQHGFKDRVGHHVFGRVGHHRFHGADREDVIAVAWYTTLPPTTVCSTLMLAMSSSGIVKKLRSRTMRSASFPTCSEPVVVS